MATEATENLAYIDDLTGFFNRRYLYDQLPVELAAAREKKQELWVIMLDIDNLKMINDTYGHLSGDQLIKDFSIILKNNTKAGDKRIRYAGDEFTIILPNVEAKNIVAIADRLIKKVDAAPFKETASGKEMRITTSIGIAGFPQDSQDPIELIKLADKSLYISKRKGKNCLSTVSEITTEHLWKEYIFERFPCPVFVDREEDLSILNAALSKASQSQSAFILITGELGAGKTRLLNEFERVVRSQDAICLSSRCVDKFMAQPYYLITSILDSYIYSLNKLPSESLENISEAEISTLFNLIPALKEMAPDLAKKYIALEEKAGSKEALSKFLLSLSRHKLLCLSLDELHYIDAQSLDVIRHIFQQNNKESRVLIVAAFSQDKLSAADKCEPPFGCFIQEDAFGKDQKNYINLSNLKLEDTKTMISGILLNVPLTSNFFEVIYKATRGNPLFIEELLKYLVEKEYIFFKNGRWEQGEIDESGLPSSVENTIERRLDELNPEIKEMIAKAAVIGENFQIDLLRGIDSEDRGYVLDLIETAKRFGLIYEKGYGAKNEFSFATSQTRNILFNKIDKDLKKHFYLRLGETIEQLYAGRLDSVAGELSYNFKNAGDYTRAKEYAKITEESKALLYDRKIEYTKSLLKETEKENLVLPLGKEAWLIAAEIIRGIYIATVNHILYPPNNQMRVKSVEDIHKKLLEVFSEVGALNITCVERNIFVNKKKVGKELADFFAESFISHINNLNIDSITFQRGIETQELSIFMDVISNPDALEENLLELLKKKNVTHISVNEISFISSREKTKEKENLQDVMFIESLLGKVPLEQKKQDLSSIIPAYAKDIAEALEQLGEQVSQGEKTDTEQQALKAEIINKSIRKIGKELLEKDAQNWPKYKEGLVKTVLSINPQLRSEVFSVQPEAGDKIDIMKELILSLPDKEVIDMITEQYSQHDIRKTRNIAQRFLSDPKKNYSLYPIIKEKLIQMKASEEECEWILSDNPEESMTSEDMADKIINTPIESLIKILPMIGIGALIKKLLSEGSFTEIHAIEEKLVNLAAEKDLYIEQLINCFKEILFVYVQDSPDNLLPKFISKLLKACVKEERLISLSCSTVAWSLEKITQIFLESNRIILINQLIKIYTRNAKSVEEYSSILDQMAIKLVDALIKKIEHFVDWRELSEAVVLLKDKGAKLMLKKALFESGEPEGKDFEAYLIRRTVGKILGQMPNEDLSNILAKKSFINLPPNESCNLIEIIGAMEKEEILNLLEAPLKDANFMTRKKTIFNLSKMKGQESARLLAIALKNEDTELREEALRALKNRKDEFAKQILKDYA